MQFTRPYTKISRIHLEAVDCQVNHSNIRGDLHITVEPEIDRLLTSLNTLAAQQNKASTSQTLTIENADPMENINTFDQQEQTQSLTLHDGVATPLALSSPTPNIPSTSQVFDSPPETVPYTQGEANDDAALPAQEQDPQSPPQLESTANSSPPKTIPLEKDEETKNETQQVNPNPDPTSAQYTFPYPIMEHKQTQTDPAFRNLASFIYSQEFQTELSKVTHTFCDGHYQRVVKHPHEVKDWILQCLSTFPGLLAEGGPYVGNVLIKPTQKQNLPKPTSPKTKAQFKSPPPTPSPLNAIPSSSTNEDQTEQEPPVDSPPRPVSLSPTPQVSELHNSAPEEENDEPPLEGPIILSRYTRGGKVYTITTPKRPVPTTTAEVHPTPAPTPKRPRKQKP